jgi:hypothetical protein
VLDRDGLEGRAARIVNELLERLVEGAEDVDYRGGTFLLTSMAAEIGQHVHRRCIELARAGDGSWELAASDADSLLTGAWRCGETIVQLTERGL